MGKARLFGFNDPIKHEHGLFNDGQFDAMNEWVVKEIGQKLAKVYPGYPWGVSAEVEHGICKIQLAGLAQWGAIIKLETLKSDPNLNSVMRRAGELLETFKLARGEGDFSKFREVLHRYPHHFYRNAPVPE